MVVRDGVDVGKWEGAWVMYRLVGGEKCSDGDSDGLLLG